MTAMLALAGNTIRELVRNKLLYLLVLFSFLLIVGSLFLLEISLGQWDRILHDVSLAVIQLSGAAVAILVGVNLVAGEIDKKTVYITLAKPVSRAQFILGKYLGLCTVLFVLVASMGAILWALLITLRLPPGLATFGALLLTFVELCVLAAFAMAFSSFTTQALGIMFTTAIFVIGRMTGDLRIFALRLHGFSHDLTVGVSYLLPNLDKLNLNTQAANHLDVSLAYIADAAAYGLLYAPIVLMIAITVFRRRDFK